MIPREIKLLYARLDWALVIALSLLMVIGVMFIYSAGYQRADLPVHGIYKKQVLWFLLGLILFMIVTALDYHWIHDYGFWLYAGALVLLVAVLFIGVKINGAYRWLNIFGVKVQPSEFAKLGVAIFLAQFLSKPGRSLKDAQTLFASLVIVGVPFLLIAKEPDLGSAAVLLPIGLCIMFVAGIPFRMLGLILVLTVLVAIPVGALFLDDYQVDRIMVFFDPDRDPRGAGWSKLQSELAVGSGGLMGKGYLNGTQNILGFLPRTVAPTDFIFSVIAEEMGFVGSALLVVLYLAVFVAIIRAALRARDRLGRLLCLGILGMLFSHVFVNLAMTVGILPITGLPLPLISYGGSFMVSTMVALGLTQSVYVRRYER